MSSTSPLSSLYLFALAALAALILQLPTRLSELVQVAGNVFLLSSLLVVSCTALVPFFWRRQPPALLTAAGYLLLWTVRISVAVIDFGARRVGLPLEVVDSILRDEERRSTLELAATRLRRRYKKQQSTLAALNDEITRVCKEHNGRSREFPTVFPHRGPRLLSAAEVASTRWTEPPLLVKMFYATDLKTVFLSRKVKQLHAAVCINQDRIRKLSAILKEEQQALDDLIPRIHRYKDKLRQEELDAMRQLKAMERYEHWRIERQNSKSIWIEELYRRYRYRDHAPLPNPVPRLRQEVVAMHAPLPTISCRVLETEMGMASCQQVVNPVPLPGMGFEVLFGCPVPEVSNPAPEVLDLVPAPVPEIQQTVLLPNT
ncbi:hypothetical protein VTH82DRAFT_2328 [Thermothelomyces myriococcoides]